MTTYYPAQGSMYAGQQPPVVYASSAAQGSMYAGQHPPVVYASSGYNTVYAPTGQPEVLFVPPPGSHHGHHRRRSRSGSRHGHHSHGQTAIAPTVVPVMQPGYAGYTTYAQGYYQLSWGERLRRFFGLAPRGPFKYKNDKGTWGFMGYSRRQRYSDPRTGAEVDRKGRPIYRV